MYWPRQPCGILPAVGANSVVDHPPADVSGVDESSSHVMSYSSLSLSFAVVIAVSSEDGCFLDARWALPSFRFCSLMISSANRANRQGLSSFFLEQKKKYFPTAREDDIGCCCCPLRGLTFFSRDGN